MKVGVLVGVNVGVLVGVFVGVLVGVSVGVLVGVNVGVKVEVFVGVLVGVLVGVNTVSVSLAVLPVPPFVEVTLPLVLFFVPDVVAVTSTETVQFPLAAIVPPVNVREVFPDAGEKVGEPHPAETDALGVEAT